MKLNDLASSILKNNDWAQVTKKQASFLINLMQKDPTYIYVGSKYKHYTNDFTLYVYPNGAGILRTAEYDAFR